MKHSTMLPSWDREWRTSVDGLARLAAVISPQVQVIITDFLSVEGANPLHMTPGLTDFVASLTGGDVRAGVAECVWTPDQAKLQVEIELVQRGFQVIDPDIRQRPLAGSGRGGPLVPLTNVHYPARVLNFLIAVHTGGEVAEVHSKKPDHSRKVEEMAKHIPGYFSRVPLPCEHGKDVDGSASWLALSSAIIHLNDGDHWSRERIADWLDELHASGTVDLTVLFPKEEESA